MTNITTEKFPPFPTGIKYRELKCVDCKDSPIKNESDGTGCYRNKGIWLYICGNCFELDQKIEFGEVSEDLPPNEVPPFKPATPTGEPYLSVVSISNTVNPEFVAELEELLQEAKAGRLHGMVYAAVDKDSPVCRYSINGWMSLEQQVYAIHLMNLEINTQILTISEPLDSPPVEDGEDE